jgi:WD40 repeat protein
LLFFLLIAALILSPAQSEAITPDNVAQLEVINRLAIICSPVQRLTFNPTNSRELLLAQRDSLVSIWDVTTAERITEWRPTETRLNAIAYTPDGTGIITAAEDGDVKIWDAATLEVVRTLNLIDQVPVVLDTAPNNIIAVGYNDGNVRLWDTNTGTSILTLYGYNGAVHMLDVSPDGSRVAFAYFFDVLVYHVENIAQQKIYIEASFDAGGAGNIYDLAFLPDPPFPPFFQDTVLVTVASLMGTDLWGIPFPTKPDSISTGSTMTYPHTLSLNHDGS